MAFHPTFSGNKKSPPELTDEDAYESIEMSETNHTKKVDHEYVRKSTCCAFMFNKSAAMQKKCVSHTGAMFLPVTGRSSPSFR